RLMLLFPKQSDLGDVRRFVALSRLQTCMVVACFERIVFRRRENVLIGSDSDDRAMPFHTGAHAVDFDVWGDTKMTARRIAGDLGAQGAGDSPRKPEEIRDLNVEP